MSVLVSRDIECPYCKHPNEAEVWSSINVKEDPELKDILLGGEINMHECRSCKEIFYVENFLLYHDPESQLMAFVYPDENRAQPSLWEEKTKADFEATQATSSDELRLPYPPVTVFGLDDLVKLVEREEEIKLQGEIAELLAKEHRFGIRKISPVQARSGQWPWVFPVSETPGRSPREALMDGLRALKNANDRLFIYTQLLERLEKTPALQPPSL